MKRFSDLITRLLEHSSQPVVAVVNAHDAVTLDAVREAVGNGLIKAVLIGDLNKIKSVLDEMDFHSDDVALIHAETDEAAAHTGVTLVREGKADVLMKGMIQTKDFLKAVVNPETGIRKNNILSHVALLEVPGYSKFICLTDGGMVIAPDLEQKKELILNAVHLMKRLGVDYPKVAVLAAVEKVNEAMVETVDGAELKRMNQRGELPGCIVEGPVSYDLAFSEASASAKCYSSDITGDADILLMPGIAAGNILAKALVYTAGGVMAGVVVGAAVPIIVTSRGATAEEKINSLSLAACLSLCD